MNKTKINKRIWIIKTIVSSIFMISVFIGNAQKPAFPGAQGWAAYTPGGRGGEIIKVTNLNSLGEGSLKEALYNPNPRIIVFEVSGTIDLNGKRLDVANPYLTIAGQTAPSPGITIINGGILVATHDVIIQHIKIRPGAAGHELGWEPDGLTTYSASNVIIDHCSFTWAVDENCSASGPRFEGNSPDEWRENTSHEITMSNNIISEGLSEATHSKGEHSKGTLIHDNVTNVAILNNLYSSNKERNPLFKGGAQGVIANNYIYNPGGLAIGYVISSTEWSGHSFETGKMSVVNNVLQYGINTQAIALVYANQGPCKIYMDGNIAKNRSANNITQYKGDQALLVNTIPVWNDNIMLVEAENLLNNLSDDIGARPWERDQIDSRIISEVKNGENNIINYETEVGGFLELKEEYAEFKESSWNLDFMLKVNPYLTVKIENKSNNSASLDLDLSDFNSGDEIEFAELYVEGILIGRDSISPYNWNINDTNNGDYKAFVVLKLHTGQLIASRTFEIVEYNLINSLEGTIAENTNSISVYPNLVKNYTNIKVHNSVAGEIQIKVFNQSGQLVNHLSSTVLNSGYINLKLDCQDLPDGLYFIHIKTRDGLACKKIIKLK